MKVICDVCGTSFPDTATHCPICGCAKSPAAQSVPADDVQVNPEFTTANTYPKGGRFAKNQVRRNNSVRTQEPARSAHTGSYGSTGSSNRPARSSDSTHSVYSSNRRRKNEPQQSNKGLVAVVIILLLAIIMVVVYIGVSVFLKDIGNKPNNGGNNKTSSAYQDDDNNSEQVNIPCTDFELAPLVHEFLEESSQMQLSMVKVPENANDKVYYYSSDEDIATVDENGMVRPGTKQGETTITVVCGAVVKECKITSFVGDPPATTQPPTTAPAAPEGFVLTLNTYRGSGEITISKPGKSSWSLYTEIMGVKRTDLTWTSSDPGVAMVTEDGKVIGVDRGKCYITATIGDQSASCLVRCAFDAPPPSGYQLNETDVTLYANSGSASFISLELKDVATGAKMQVTWTADKEGAVEISDTGKVTALDVTESVTVNVSTEYDGKTYTCVVRVHPKKS